MVVVVVEATSRGLGGEEMAIPALVFPEDMAVADCCCIVVAVAADGGFLFTGGAESVVVSCRLL